MTSIVSSIIVSQQQKPENWDGMMWANMVPAHVSSEYLREIGFYQNEIGAVGKENENERSENEDEVAGMESENDGSENEVAGMESENEGSENEETIIPQKTIPKTIPKKNPKLISKKRRHETIEPRDPKEIRDEFREQGIELVTRRTYKEIIRPQLLNDNGEALLVLEKRSGRSRAKGDFVLFEDGSKAFEFIEVLPGTTYQGLLVLVARTRDGVIPSLNKIATAYNQLVGLPGAKSAPLHFFGNNYQSNPLFVEFKDLLGCKERKERNNKKSKVEQSNVEKSE